MDLKDKVVLITGSTRGLGKAMALAFAKKNAKLILNGRKEMPVDLKEKLDELKADVLINKAGINRDKMWIGMRDDDFDQVIDLDLRVPFFMTKWAIKKMMKQKSGSIINMTSIVGLHGNVGQANYAAAKAGLIGFTKAAAKEAAIRGIRVNAIAPGMIDTDMTQALSEKVQKNILGQIPLSRFGEATEVAEAAIFLAQNDYITGQTIVVDGGMTI